VSKKPGFFKAGLLMVEVAGVEPASEELGQK